MNGSSDDSARSSSGYSDVSVGDSRCCETGVIVMAPAHVEQVRPCANVSTMQPTIRNNSSIVA
jgi:hypothetical protein